MSEQMSEEEQNEQILSHLEGLKDLGLIDYFIPTEPVGKEWIVGHKNQILKFTTSSEIQSFFLGIRVVTDFMTERKRAGIL